MKGKIPGAHKSIYIKTTCAHITNHVPRQCTALQWDLIECGSSKITRAKPKIMSRELNNIKLYFYI